jgi:hypothetical protein
VVEAVEAACDQPITWILRFATNALGSNSRQDIPEGAPNQLTAVLGFPNHASLSDPPHPLCRFRYVIEVSIYAVQTSRESSYNPGGGYSNRVAEGKGELERGSEWYRFQVGWRKPAPA